MKGFRSSSKCGCGDVKLIRTGVKARSVALALLGVEQMKMSVCATFLGASALAISLMIMLPSAAWAFEANRVRVTEVHSYNSHGHL